MKASTRMKVMVAATEAGLRDLGFDFFKSDARELVEFEVSKPEQFMVRITHLPELEYPSAVVGLGFSSRLRESTDFRIQFSTETPGARASAAGLVKHVLASLKVPPWKGLGLIESGTAKALWKRAAEGRS